MDDEPGGERMYTQEELNKKKKEYDQEQKMDFMIDMINDNTRDIEDIKDTLHNGWDRQLWYNSLFRKGGLWFFGMLLAGAVGYLFTTL